MSLEKLEKLKNTMPIVVSFSGGRTSAYLSARMLKIFPREQLTFVFMNTGQEHPKTLEFIDKCDKHFEMNLTWLESVVHMRKGYGTTHRIVDFETATRDIRLFKDMAIKYGLPGPGWLHCTRELKTQPFHSFVSSELESKKLKGYYTAIGIRVDEIDRCDPKMEEKNFIYPLCDLGVTKPMVLDFWKKQPFDLEIPDYLGNCTWCWKKTNRKLNLIAERRPKFLKEAQKLEKYSDHGAGESRKMFRGHLTATDILNNANQLNFAEDVIEGSCAESCEPFTSDF